MMLFAHVARTRPNEPLFYASFLCLRMTERFARGARASDVHGYADEAARAHRDGVALERM
jgi:hypothetical protein